MPPSDIGDAPASPAAPAPTPAPPPETVAPKPPERKAFILAKPLIDGARVVGAGTAVRMTSAQAQTHAALIAREATAHDLTMLGHLAPIDL